MTRQQLREKMWQRFGRRLERGTLSELAQAVVECQLQATDTLLGLPFAVDTMATDHESAMREFFGQVLATEGDGGWVHLWLAAVQLWLAVEPAGEAG